MDQPGTMVSMDQLAKYVGEEVIEKKVLRDQLQQVKSELAKLKEKQKGEE